MSLTKVSYSMIQGSPINVVDYGAKGDGLTDDTAAVQAALSSQQSLDCVLVFPAGTYDISSQITQTLTAPMAIYCDGEVTLNWSSASTATHLWKMTLNGNAFSNIGPGTLTIQGNNKLSKGIDIINDVDSSRPDVDLGNMRAINLLADNAVGFGISVSGRLGTVRGNILEVNGLTRTTSAGSCQGIAIYRTSFTRAPLKVLINEAIAKNVSCPDADWDADGLLVYTNFEDGVEVHVKRASFYNCRGRGFKFQTGAIVPVIDDLYYYRDVDPVSSVQSSKVGAGQYGALLVRQATIEFAGSTTHSGAGTVLFDVSHPSTDLTRGISPAMIENITVFNNSTDTTPIELCSAPYTGSDTNERLISLKNWKVFGGAVRCVSSLLSLGQTNRTRFDIENLLAPFALSTRPAVDRGCLFFTNGNGLYLTGSITGVINTTSDVELPLVRDYAGAENPVGQFFDGGGNRGWKIYNGAAVNKVSGLQITGVGIGNPANYEGTGFLGGIFVRTFFISNGSTITVPAFGYRGTGSGEFKAALHDYGTSGEYSIVGGSTMITTIRAASANIQIGNGSEPGSGILRIWKNGIDGPLNLKAVGDNVYVTLVTFPI